MAEDVVAKFTKAMNIPKNIRNIATSAHIHHGKCVSGKSRVLLEDGSIMSAKDIFDEISKNGLVYENTEEHIIFAPKKDINIFSLNKVTGKFEIKPIQYAWKLVGGKTIKTKLRNGFEVTTTPEHKYVIYRNMEFADVEAKDLKLGDRIVCSRKLETKSKLDMEKEILQRLSMENFYVHLNSQFHIKLKKKIHSYSINKLTKDLNISIKYRSFYEGLLKNRYNLNDLVKICNLFDISLTKVYYEIDLIFYRNGKQRGQNSLKMKLPYNFEEFFYLAGLFIGDGSRSKFIVGKPQLAEKIIDISKTLNLNPRKVSRDDRTPELHFNLTLVYILKSLFDYPLRKKSHNVKISDFVFKSDNKYVAQFLKAYFDTDGGVEKSRRAVTIYSVSDQMIEDLHLLLLRFGCVSIKEKDNTISISGFSAINFKENIGFTVEHKIESLNLLVSKVCGGIVCDAVTQGNQVMLIKNKLISENYEELAFIEIKSLEQGYEEIVYDLTIDETHNFVAEGMVIHNTALTDCLLAAAGLMNVKAAGDLQSGMTTWQHADEQERLMTVDAANVSMVHQFDNEEFLINLIDTPGHVDFGGNVTRAMRAIDGTIVLVCASEGIMPQTETVVKQALRERVKPVLFINKVDRLIKEMQYTPEQMQKRFTEIITQFNQLVLDIAEKGYGSKWQVSIQDGSVAFGSARDNWALSFSFMQKKGVKFKDILNLYNLPDDERKKWVWENAPAHEVLLDMVIKHLPSPLEAQKYRIGKIWHGDTESELGKSLLSCDPNGKIAFCITRVMVDPKSGREIAAGRLFSGTMRTGDQVYLNLAKKYVKLQQVLIYNGIKAQQMDEIVAGNVMGVMGVSGEAGETLTSEPDQPFEELTHIFEPVITKAIEPVRAQDLSKVIEVLNTVSKEDPSIKIKINEETGECLMSGMGELHLEIVENRIKTEKHVDIKSSPPLVVYREAITKKSPEVEGKSPNKHNKFYVTVEPMPEGIISALKSGEIHEGRIKKKDDQLINALVGIGWDTKEARNVKQIYRGNMLVDNTRGIVHVGEVIELVTDAVQQVMDAGPLAREPGMGILIRLIDMKLHEDSIHRGPAQIYPAMREAIRDAMKQANPIILEPMQVLQIEAGQDHMGTVSKLVSSKRGQLLDMQQEGAYVTIKAKLPVAEMIGLSSDLRSATEGRGTFFVVDQSFERLPSELQSKIVQQIRQRKGLSENA